jgi:hypothetical protein
MLASGRLAPNVGTETEQLLQRLDRDLSLTDPLLADAAVLQFRADPLTQVSLKGQWCVFTCVCVRTRACGCTSRRQARQKFFYFLCLFFIASFVFIYLFYFLVECVQPLTTLPTTELDKEALALWKSIQLFTSVVIDTRAIAYHVRLAQDIVRQVTDTQGGRAGDGREILLIIVVFSLQRPAASPFASPFLCCMFFFLGCSWWQYYRLTEQGLTHPELQNELYCQLIRMTRNHPYPNSAQTMQCWQLMAFALPVYLPSAFFMT